MPEAYEDAVVRCGFLGGSSAVEADRVEQKRGAVEALERRSNANRTDQRLSGT